MVKKIMEDQNNNESVFSLEIKRKEEYSRAWAALSVFPLMYIKMFAIIPQAIILGLMGIVMFFVFTIGNIAVVLTGKFPEGMHSFLVKYIRQQMRIGLFMLGLDDKYPPIMPE